MENYIDIYGL